MAQTDRFMIAPIETGVQTNLKPWIIPDDAFQQLNNMYVFRGRVRKRFGSRLTRGSTQPTTGFEQLQSRVRINLGDTDGSGDASGNVPGAIFEVGQMFSVGNQLFTVSALGTPATLLSSSAGLMTYNTNTGGYILTGATINTPLYFYPATPIMGIASYEQANTENNLTYVFDTQFAYQFTSSGWIRLGTAIWTGDDSDYFWWSNYRGTNSDETFLYVSNYNFGSSLSDSDIMQYWDGSSWNDFNPGFNSVTATDTIVTAKIIIPFKDRLLLLNVVENTGSSPGTNTLYVNRCRYSWNGDPTNAAAFYEDVAGSGGYIDAPTKESIITAQFLKDRLIIYFTTSTWELVYTSNQILPFVWQKINTELGAISTFSEVPFDKVVLGIDENGVHACNGSNVERIDDKIPDTVFQVQLNNQDPNRVYGIRDYFTEMVYWSFPGDQRTSFYKFNNTILTYNYKTGSWAFNDDSITVFGYFQPNANEGDTWQSDIDTWQTADYTWSTPSSPTLSGVRSILAGNQQGYVFILNTELSRNSPSLQITNMTFSDNFVTIICTDHNLVPGFAATNISQAFGDYILLENIIGVTGLNPIYEVYSIIDENTFTIYEPNFAGTYLGGGTISLVSNPNIVTKQYNFYVQEGRNALINKVDFLVDKTTNGEVTVDYSVSSSSLSSLQQGVLNGSLLGTSKLETSPYALIPLEQTQDRLWHPVYPMAEGECIQLNIYLSYNQILNEAIALSDFELHAMTFFTQKTSSRLQ